MWRTSGLGFESSSSRGRGFAVGILTNRLGDVPGDRVDQVFVEEDAYKEWLLLTEGVEWAKGSRVTIFPHLLTCSSRVGLGV